MNAIPQAQARPPGFPEEEAFPLQHWRRLALQALRSAGRADPGHGPADVERLLSTAGPDGLALRPLYLAGGSPAPAAAFTRGRPVGTGWQVRQRHADPDPVTTRDAVAADLAGGVDALWLVLGPAAIDPAGLAQLLADVDLGRVAVALDAGPATASAARTLLEAAGQRPGLTGTLGADPLAEQARTGEPADRDMLGDRDMLARLTRERPGLRAATVDATVHHDAGCGDVDELACSVATGVTYLRWLTGAGLGVPQALEQLEFRYSAGTDQFATIVKLRAARRLWARVAQVCGVAGARQYQHAVTSSVMLTAWDPWGNVVRATLAAFAAAVGGADALSVQPFDSCLGPPDEVSRRLARNTQAVLRDEAHLARVTDPAGGSWYVESRTEDLAARAWERFAVIEAAGGMPAALTTGLVAGWAAAGRAARDEDVARVRAPIVGVSAYPDLTEPAPPRRPGEPGAWRPAEAFERLRDRAEAHLAATGRRPQVLLVPSGAGPERASGPGSARTLFAAGGIGTVEARGGQDLAAALAAAGTTVACLAGPEPAGAAGALAAAGARRVWLAGPPAAVPGVTGYLYPGCDVPAALEATLADLGVP